MDTNGSIESVGTVHGVSILTELNLNARAFFLRTKQTVCKNEVSVLKQGLTIFFNMFLSMHLRELSAKI